MRVYIGYSETHDSDQILEWLDIDPKHPEGVSVFERMFGCGYIRPGDFEVYGVEDMDGQFSVEQIKECFPFELGELNLWTVNLHSATCVFWIRSGSEWSTMAADGVVITDVLEVEKLDFE